MDWFGVGAFVSPCNDGSAPSRYDGGPWASWYYLCIDRQTNETVLAARDSAWVEDALTDVDMQIVPPPRRPGLCMHLPDGDNGVRADRPELCELHMETGMKIVVFGHSLRCGVAVLFMIKLLGGEVRLLKGLKAYQTFRCSSFAAPPCFGPWVKTRRWVCPTIVKTHFTFKQVLPTERLTCSSFADQRLEQHLPYHVDLMHELDEHFLALRIIGTLLLRTGP